MKVKVEIRKIRTAHECAPRKCRRCSCSIELPKAEHGYPWPSSVFKFLPDMKAPFREKVWFIKCPQCDTTYVWSWHPVSNGCWMIRSINPLFDFKEVVTVA